MNPEKLFFFLCSILWTAGILLQQICWMRNGYNIFSFVIALIELSMPYLVYNVLNNED